MEREALKEAGVMFSSDEEDFNQGDSVLVRKIVIQWPIVVVIALVVIFILPSNGFKTILWKATFDPRFACGGNTLNVLDFSCS